jgi:hypothetical protein
MLRRARGAPNRLTRSADELGQMKLDAILVQLPRFRLALSGQLPIDGP